MPDVCLLMWPRVSRCLLLALLLCCGAVRAAASDADAGAVVTCQPVTVAGHDFCHYFLAAWRDKEGSERFPLAIRERPSARWGSEVTIEHAQRPVYRARLPAARAAIRAVSEEAADATWQAVQQAQLQQLQRQLAPEADLAPDEF